MKVSPAFLFLGQPSTPFQKLCGEKWQFEIVLNFIRFEACTFGKRA